jgi:ABC-type Na+ efflux pump permease subunit
MRLWKAWLVAGKDFSTFRRKKNIFFSIVLLPIAAAIGTSLVIQYARIQVTTLPSLLSSFSFLFVVVSAALPTAVASYSLVGEKLEGSLEPLLATPTTDGEILLGKGLAVFLLPMVGIYLGAVVFMALIDAQTYANLGYFYFPNANMGVILLIASPLSAMLSVELNVIISGKTSDVRAAQHLGALVVLPFVGIFIASQLGMMSLNIITLIYMSAVLWAVDMIFFHLTTITFRRDEILTKWK